jgi:hypothetical protein
VNVARQIYFGKDFREWKLMGTIYNDEQEKWCTINYFFKPNNSYLVVTLSEARWSDNLRRTTVMHWMPVAEDRARWREVGEAYAQQWTVVG